MVTLLNNFSVINYNNPVYLNDRLQSVRYNDDGVIGFCISNHEIIKSLLRMDI